MSRELVQVVRFFDCRLGGDWAWPVLAVAAVWAKVVLVAWQHPHADCFQKLFESYPQLVPALSAELCPPAQDRLRERPVVASCANQDKP